MKKNKYSTIKFMILSVSMIVMTIAIATDGFGWVVRTREIDGTNISVMTLSIELDAFEYQLLSGDTNTYGYVEKPSSNKVISLGIEEYDFGVGTSQYYYKFSFTNTCNSTLYVGLSYRAPQDGVSVNGTLTQIINRKILSYKLLEEAMGVTGLPDDPLWDGRTYESFFNESDYVAGLGGGIEYLCIKNMVMEPNETKTIYLKMEYNEGELWNTLRAYHDKTISISLPITFAAYASTKEV